MPGAFSDFDSGSTVPQSSVVEGATPRAEVGIVGGSGLYSFLDDAAELDVDTPWGPPSAPLLVGSTGGRSVAFVPRHGRHHEFPPHRVNYRANLWALRSVGVRQVIAPCAVGSLRPEIAPGALVVPDQIVDRTWGRPHTFFDEPGVDESGVDEPGVVVHVAMADPYCARGRAAALTVAREIGTGAVDGGTLVVINGPRFSTRAESRWHAAAGWSLVGMTGMPEAALARELALCYTALALVTDLDAGADPGEGVTHTDVVETFATHIGRVRTLLHALVPALPANQSECSCAAVHHGVTLPFALP